MTDDARALLFQLPDNGLALGNGTLRDALGWDESRYDAERDALVAFGLAEKGRGRGGSHRRTGAPYASANPPSALSPSSFVPLPSSPDPMPAKSASGKSAPGKSKITKEKSLETWIRNAACSIRGAKNAQKDKYYIVPKTVPVALAEVPMAINQDMKAIVPGARLRSDFLLYALETFRDNLFKKVGRAGHGTCTLMGHEVTAFKIPLPDLKIQQEIAAEIQNLERKNAFHAEKHDKLQDLFRTILHELMTAKSAFKN